MEAAGDVKASAMTVNGKKGTGKKIFRARKTMSPSCRTQIAALNKLKNTSKIKTFLQGSSELPKENVQQPQNESVLVEKCIAQKKTHNASAEMDLNSLQSNSPNGFKTSSEDSRDVPELKPGSLESIWKKGKKTCEKSGVRTPAGKHIVNNSSSTNEKGQPNEVREVSSSSGVEEKGKQISVFDPLQDFSKDSVKTNIDNCSPVFDKLSESSTLKTMNENSFLRMNSVIGLVTPMDVLKTDSTNAVVPSNMSGASCGTTGTSNSVIPSFTTGLHADPASNQSSQGSTKTSGDCQKKRCFPGDSDVPEAKRSKISNKSLLDEVDILIQRRIQTVLKESFDQRIQDLSQQINLIQCKEDHADLFTRQLRSIKKLGRRIKYALQIQNEAGTQSSKLPSISSTSKELPTTEAATTSFTNPPTEVASTSLTKNDSMQNLSTDCSNLVVLSDNEKEKQSDQGQTELKNPSKKVDYSAIQKIMESIKEHRNKTLSSRMDKQAMAVIDLTDDEGQKSDRDMKLDESYLSSTYTASPTAAPVLQDIKESPLLKCPEIKEMLFKHRESETFYDGKTPSGHKSVNIHNSHSEISPNADPLMLKPPQKPELRLAQVQNPKGIALSWNIPHTDPSCAPAQVYCLYVHQENPNNSKKLWKKIGEIKALPLPMACTLTQFVDYTTYSFVLRAKDAYGRFGPLCDIQSTTLNNSKKT